MTVPGNLSSPLLATAAAAGGDTEFSIQKSVRFNDDDSAYFSKTPSSAGNRRTFTWSGWFKRSTIDGTHTLFAAGSDANNRFALRFSSGQLFIVDQIGGGAIIRNRTEQQFRDPSSWYHFVVAIDSTQSTSTDRLKLYANGGLVEDYDITNYPSLNQQFNVNSTVEHLIGKRVSESQYFDGYMANMYFIDGLGLAASDFGFYDSNNVWRPKEYSGTFGTNGFHLFDFANESTIGHDSSGNNNDFTANNLNAVGVNQPFSGAGGAVGGGTTSDYVQVSASGHSDFSLDGVFTAEWWHYRSSSTANTYMWTLGDSSQSSGLELYWGSSGSSLKFFTAGSDTSVTATSATGWKHYAVVRDSSNNIKIYYDGTLGATISNSTTFSGNITFGEFYNGSITGGLLGPISNFRLVKGSAVYTANFTPPTSALTAITNTKLLTFQGSTIADASGTSKSISTNGSISTDLGSGANLDVLFDVPTNDTTNTDSGAGGEVSGNYAVLNPLNKHNSNNSLSNGNLEFTTSGSDGGLTESTIAVSSGKFYFEVVYSRSDQGQLAGIRKPGSRNYNDSYIYVGTGNKYTNGGSGASYGATLAHGDVIGTAFDADNGTLTFYKNGTSQGQAFSGISGTYSFFVGSFGGPPTGIVNFGARQFSYAAPSGFKALNTASMSAATIADGSAYFQTALWSGTGSARSITTTGMSPDWVWIKERGVAGGHNLYDAVRGATKFLASEDNNAEGTDSSALTSFNSDGFSLGTGFTVKSSNKSGRTYAGWCWDAGSSTASNTDGSVTSSVRANQTAGFSIVSYTGDGSTTTWGHGLSVAPKLIFFKRRNNPNNWFVLADVGVHSGFTIFEGLNNTNAGGDYSSNASASNTIVTLPNTTDWNTSGGTYIAYCFTPVAGYSAISSFEANGSTDGPFVHLGFRPRFLIIKNATDTTHATSYSWVMIDTARYPDNRSAGNLNPLYANKNAIENLYGTGSGTATGLALDILSNGFKVRSGNAELNFSGTYIYYAVAENPFQANGGLAR